MKKVIVALLCGAMLTGMLAGCGSDTKEADTGSDSTSESSESEDAEETADAAEETGDDEELTEGTFSFAVFESELKFTEEVVAAFNEDYPGIDVELVQFADLQAANQGAQAAHQASDDYDLMIVNHVDMMAFQKAGMLYPIGELAERDGIDLDSVFLGSLMEACKVDGMAYTIPHDTDNRVIAYNKELFEKYNLEYPETMDEMLECGKVMTQNGDYLFTYALTGDIYTSAYNFGVFLQSVGGGVYEMDDNGNPVATIDTPEMLEYLTFIKELQQYMPENAATTTPDEARNQFASGNVGMYIFGPWEFNSLELDGIGYSENLGFTVDLGLVPAGSAGHCSTSGGYQMGIGAGGENVETAWTFIKWLINNPEYTSILCGTNLPVTEAGYAEGTYAGEDYAVFMEQQKTSKVPQVAVPNLPEVMTCFDNYWQEMLFDKLTPEEVCEQAQPAVQELLDENIE